MAYYNYSSIWKVEVRTDYHLHPVQSAFVSLILSAIGRTLINARPCLVSLQDVESVKCSTVCSRKSKILCPEEIYRQSFEVSIKLVKAVKYLFDLHMVHV